jgi:hypothetical protein
MGLASMKQFYLHIGFEKTGTTSLQSYCRRNLDLLADCGILFPRSMAGNNHWGLMPYALDPAKGDRIKWSHGLNTIEKSAEFQEQFRQSFTEEIRQSPAERVVLTLEQLSSRVTEIAEAQRLRDLMEEAGIQKPTVVVYVRPQAEFIVSLYSTKVKTGQQSDPFSLPTPGDGEFDFYTYLPTLDLWATAFGEENVVVRVFQRGRLFNADIIDDFFHTIGAPPAALSGKRPPTLNIGLDPVTLEMTRRLNPHLGPAIDESGANPYRKGLRLLLEKISTGEKAGLSATDADIVMRTFAATNDQIARRFCAGPPLFDEIIDSRAESFHRKEISDEAIFSRVAALLKLQRDVIDPGRA